MAPAFKELNIQGRSLDMDPSNRTRGKVLRACGEAQELLQRDRRKKKKKKKDQRREKAESTSWKRRYLSWVLQEGRVGGWRGKKFHR